MAEDVPGRRVTSLPDAAAIRRALERRDLIHGLTVDYVMVIVGQALEARDAEIAKLRYEAEVGRRLMGENERLRRELGAAKSGSEEGERDG